MAIFGRRRQNGVAPVTTKHARPRRRFGSSEPYTMMSRPTFGQWLKATWLDILTMIFLGAVGLGVYFAHPAPTRSFAVTFPSDGEVVYPQFAYPLRKEIIPIWLAALLAALIPIVVILFMQIRIRSFWDVNNAIMGLLYSLITAAVFQVFVKWLIGGLRPHFLDVCKPDLSRASNAPGVVGAGLNGVGFKQIYFTREICTGDPDEIDDSLESMPSGHATAAFAGFIFLALYLNAKLKVFSNYHPAMWKLAAVYSPVLGACLISGALTIDEFHHWYDITAGGVIGTIMAFSAYRMTYASIWDWRWNHIPLNRISGFQFGHGGEAELGDATFTRRGGWGRIKSSHTKEHHGIGGTHGVMGNSTRGAPVAPVAAHRGARGDDLV
ncbi:phosphatidic acid phosphatase type 2/haloperoxidase [Lasiosphaeris hirsuta]|uniref:Phosphatidic acid phosphatase type 2/haloperoxidase n=1 Tax=Lasiosphaeris hirsuta TaxID=260670 RepID=A0AA40AHV8_9PEZI|nr:phosphatidic acid phosphatase type 2/haloperoxidase [Lasiosphaeris hirsuta]